MSDEANIGANGEITAEACAWVAQLESGNLSASDLAALREWMGRSPAHASEIREIAKLSGQLAILTEMAEPLAEAAAMNSALRRPKWRRMMLSPAFAAASVALVALALFGLLYSTDVDAPTAAPPEVYQTAVGEYQTVTLADGSTATLNTDSQIEVGYSETARRIRLIQGEVLFDVTHAPDRLFVVYSGETVAQAIGTSFVVRLRDKVTELAVVTGVVAFSKIADAVERQIPSVGGSVGRRPVPQEPAELPPPIIVRAGQTMTSVEIPADEIQIATAEIPTISTREIQRRLSWTEGLFDFSETPLDEVVTEISRHNDVRIDIADADLKALKFGGMFRTGDVDALLEALEGLGVEVERRAPGHYVLHGSGA